MADTWATKTAMTAGKGYIGSANIGSDKAYAVGGTPDDTNHLDTNYEYSQAGDSWLTKTALPATRAYLACSTIGADKLYAFCGLANQVFSSKVNTTYEYSQTGNSWATKTANPMARFEFLAATIGNDKAYTHAGRVGTSTITDANSEYSQAGNSWTAKAVTIGSAYHNGYNIGNMFYAVAGLNDNRKGNREYNQASDVWTAKTFLSTGQDKERHGAASVGSNDGFVYGGSSSGSNVVATAYNWAQNTNAWTVKASMPVAKSRSQGATIGSYKCYMFGGYDGTNYVATNYEYTAFDPQPETSLTDLKTFLDAQYPILFEDLKSDIRAFAWLLQDLKTDIRASALESPEDLKTSLTAYGWSLTDLKTALSAYANYLEDLKCDIATSSIVFTDLKCELKTKDASGPYVSGNPSPAPNQAGVAVNSNIVIVIKDNGWGVDVNSIWVDVKDNQTGLTTRYKNGDAGFSYTLSSDKRACTVTIDPTANFEYNRNISVSAFASDLAGNPGLPQVT